MILKGSSKIIYNSKNVLKIYKGATLAWQQITGLADGMLKASTGSGAIFTATDPTKYYTYTLNSSDSFHSEITLPPLKPNTWYSYKFTYKLPGGTNTMLKVFLNNFQIQMRSVGELIHDLNTYVPAINVSRIVRFTFFSGTAATNKIKIIMDTIPAGTTVTMGNHAMQETPIYRYVRNSINGSNHNLESHFIEIEAINADGTNSALSRPVTSNVTPYRGNLAQITNGNVSRDDYVDMGEVNAWAKVDLGENVPLFGVRMYHYYKVYGRKYKGNILEVSKDGLTWDTVFNSNVDGEYEETFVGKLIHLF